MFSLPYALLMWRWVISFNLLSLARLTFSFPNISMVSFLVAFLLFCFEDSDTVTLSLIGSLSGVITVLVAWCIWTSWENHPVSDAHPSEKSLSFEENEDSEERPKKFTFEVVVPETTSEPHFSVLGFQFPPSLSFDWPSFPHRRRQSYDSNGTIVEDPWYSADLLTCRDVYTDDLFRPPMKMYAVLYIPKFLFIIYTGLIHDEIYTSSIHILMYCNDIRSKLSWKAPNCCIQCWVDSSTIDHLFLANVNVQSLFNLNDL